METRRKEEAFKTSSHKPKQITFKKKKKNYSIQHNFYDQKPCLNHNKLQRKTCYNFFEEKQFSINKADPGQKDGRTKIEDTRQI